jgi:hypothetical protein
MRGTSCVCASASSEIARARPRNERATIDSHIRRNAREEIRVTLGAWNGAPVFGIRAWFRADDGTMRPSIRAWFKADDGTMRPSKDGLTLRAALLPELARALADAERQARGDRLLAASVPSKVGGADG